MLCEVRRRSRFTKVNDFSSEHSVTKGGTMQRIHRSFLAIVSVVLVSACAAEVGTSRHDDDLEAVSQAVCHDVCTIGDAQAATCSTCAASICAADSFCCTTTWDS